MRARMADQQAEMELAVEDQQLQKTAAVKQQELATAQLQQKCDELVEVCMILYITGIVV